MSEKAGTMDIKVGCDIVHIPTFEDSVRSGADLFLARILRPPEQSRYTTGESQAGVFALKEAVMKALGVPAGSWHDIEVANTPDGKPMVSLLQYRSTIDSSDVSIAHHGEYAIAVVVFSIVR